MKYRVEIRETLRKVVEVEAESPSQAIEKVREQWLDEEYVLGGDDFYDVEFEDLPSCVSC